MSYLKAVLKKDTKSKIRELKKLILLGKKLKKDTRPDVKKLEILENRHKLSSASKKIKVTTSIKNSINSVYTKDNSIIVNFEKKISKDFIKFFELKRASVYKDIFDIKGNFKDAAPTKLKLSSVDKVSIGQFKDKTLRIVLAHKTNLKTNYKINSKQIIISVQGNKPTSKPKTKPKEKVKTEQNKFIDLKNNIRTIQVYDKKIVIKFNKDFSKNDFKYASYKSNNKYENVFDIKGKFKYTKPLKLKIDGINRIIVSKKDDKNIRIRLSNKTKLKVFYIVNKRELIIKVSGLSTSNKKKKEKSTLPYANFKSKTIVIDAGHGAQDPGAIGPNKRYEKVVTLKVAKYLYSILKQRGHKVYLTRSKDTFIKVGKRTDLALRKNADVFISIHANSVPKKVAHKVTGIETYYLSPAKTERAKRVAAKENKTDIRKMSNSSTQSFLASLNSPKLRYSRLLSIDVQREMLASVRTKYNVKDKGSRPGPFWVLLDAPQASILVEVGYISNKIEGKRLYTSAYQKLLAQGMANGIDAYFQMKARFD